MRDARGRDAAAPDDVLVGTGLGPGVGVPRGGLGIEGCAVGDVKDVQLALGGWLDGEFCGWVVRDVVSVDDILKKEIINTSSRSRD